MSRFLRAEQVLLPTGMRAACIEIDHGRIVAIRDYADVPAGAPLLEVPGTHLLPGLVDTHVHINDPGRSDWEGFYTATRAAAAGGVTTLVDMPLNSIPSSTNAEAIACKLRAMEGKAHVDIGICAGLVPENAANAGDLFREGVLAFKCFLADTGVNEFSHVNERELEAGMRSIGRVGAPLFVHAELPGPLLAAAHAQGDVTPEAARRYAAWLDSRPKTAEDEAVALVIRMSELTGARAHIVHLSSASALPLIARAHDAKIALSAETCPHYLTFAAEDIPDGDTAYKCAPPIRERANRERLWQALREGLMHQVVTDHSPATVELKCSQSGDFMRAWGGISSLQLGFAVVQAEGAARGLSFTQVVELMSSKPAELVGLTGKKGSIVVGADADFAFWDPSATWTVDAMQLEHRNKITPYAGRQVLGRVVRTLLRGETIFELNADGLQFARPAGGFLRRRLGAA
jgi:allantoinase